jgi:hypothetical protein
VSYSYEVEKSGLFTEQEQQKFLAVRDKARELLALAGAVRMDKLMIGSGDGWKMLARVDRLVELGELREVTPDDGTAGQDRVFVSTGRL